MSIFSKASLLLLMVSLAVLPACATTTTVTVPTTVLTAVTIPTTVISKITTTVTSTVTTTVTKATTTTTSQASTTITTSQAPATTQASYLASEALAKGLIAIKINGYAGVTFGGVSSGDVIAISFLRQVPDTIKITVPLGTTLVCSDSSAQNMVILKLKGRDPSILGYYPLSEITLNKDEWQVFLFEAYCLDMNKSNIWNSTTFSIGEPVSQEIAAMLSAAKALGTAKAPPSAIQVALWALTSNPTLEELRKRFTADDQTIAGAWAILDTAGLNPGSRKIFTGYTPI
jgi:hypothetical protein